MGSCPAEYACQPNLTLAQAYLFRQHFGSRQFNSKNLEHNGHLHSFVLLSLKVFAACGNFSGGRLSRVRHSRKDYLTTKLTKDTETG